MRFNFEVSPGDKRFVQVTDFGHLATISLWMGDPMQAAESQYKIQFGDAWAAMDVATRSLDAVRVAIAHALMTPFDPVLITLLIDDELPRWQGAVTNISAPK